jgi:hypothetical protein
VRLHQIIEDHKSKQNDPFVRARRDFVQHLVLRYPCKPPQAVTYFELSAKEKRNFVASQPIDPSFVDRLINIPNVLIGPELYGLVEPEERPKDIYDRLLESVYNE